MKTNNMAMVDKNPIKHSDRISVMLIISSLAYGGAERQVVELLKRMDRARFEPFICSLSTDNPLSEKLLNIDKDLVVVAKQGRFDLNLIFRVADLMKKRHVDVVHAFLFDAEITARLAAKIAGVPVVIASERNSDYKRPVIHTIAHWLTRALYNGMIANSMAGKRFNVRTLRLNEDSIYVIHNGIDTDIFRPDMTGRNRIRKELGIAESDLLVGMVASYKRQKRHQDFFRMAKIVAEKVHNVKFVLVGETQLHNRQDSESYHREVLDEIGKFPIPDVIKLLNGRSDMPDIYNACDVTTLTSEREGTPNVLLESMACNVPVVATDIADNSYIVKDGVTGYVVPVGRPELMADRVCSILENSAVRNELGISGREWVSKEFSRISLAKKTEAVYLKLLDENS